jgi:hypothetical protein
MAIIDKPDGIDIYVKPPDGSSEEFRKHGPCRFGRSATVGDGITIEEAG